MSTEQLTNQILTYLNAVANKLQGIIDTTPSAIADREDFSQHEVCSGVSTLSAPTRSSSPPSKGRHSIDEDKPPLKKAHTEYDIYDQHTTTQRFAPTFLGESEGDEIFIGTFSPDQTTTPSEHGHVDDQSQIALEMPFVLFKDLLNQCTERGILNAIQSLPEMHDEIKDVCVKRSVDLISDEYDCEQSPSKQKYSYDHSQRLLGMPSELFKRLLNQCSEIGILNTIQSLSAMHKEINDACLERILDLIPDEEYNYTLHILSPYKIYDYEIQTLSEPLGHYSSESGAYSL